MPYNQLGYVVVTSLETSVCLNIQRHYWVSIESFSILFLYYAAADIVKYLFEEYGAGRQPSPGLLERLANQSTSHVMMDMIENTSDFVLYKLCALDI